MDCKNCGHKVEGKFCSNCGQNSKVKRIDFPTVISEFTEGVFQINKGFLYTLKELFLRPGKSLNDFLNGKRKNHFKPIAYLLTMSTLYYLITKIANQNTWIFDAVKGLLNGATANNSSESIIKIATWLTNNYAYAALILLPLFSLASYLSFYKFRKNYFEHFVINSYITGQQAILYSLFAIGESASKSNIFEFFSLLTAISYTFYVFWQFFSGTNRMMNILRTFMTYILFFSFSFGFLLTLLFINAF